MEEEPKEEGEQEEQIDLVDDYQKFLKKKKQIQNQQEEDQMEIEKNLDTDFVVVPD